MCEVSEKIYAEGKAEGELNAKKMAAYNMRKKDYSAHIIAELLEVSIPTVEQWFDSSITGEKGNEEENT